MKGMTKNLDVQYVTDNQGNKTGVLISIEDWQLISSEITEYLKYQALKNSLIEAFGEVEQLKKGEKEQVSLTTFLNEC